MWVSITESNSGLPSFAFLLGGSHRIGQVGVVPLLPGRPVYSQHPGSTVARTGNAGGERKVWQKSPVQDEKDLPVRREFDFSLSAMP